MRVLVAGATGVLGRSLVRKLLNRGHSVVGTTRTPSKLEELKETGADSILMDGLDPASVLAAVAAARADVVVNEMTALAEVRNYRKFDEEFRMTNRLREEGTHNLLSAAKTFGAKRIVVQSFAGWPLRITRNSVNSEQAPYEDQVPLRMKQSQEAIKQMETVIASSQNPVGVVLRYGHFYGRDTAFGPDGDVVKAVRTRGFPLVGRGAAVWSFVHVDDAAEATRIAIESAPGGIYNVADDSPARVSEWLPELARIVGAKSPMTLPSWLGKLLIGESGHYLMNRARGADNSKAKTVLKWTPSFPDWRLGFTSTLS